MENKHIDAILNVRKGLIDGHRTTLDGATNPDTAICKQKDVALILERAIAQLDEILESSRNVIFQ